MTKKARALAAVLVTLMLASVPAVAGLAGAAARGAERAAVRSAQRVVSRTVARNAARNAGRAALRPAGRLPVVTATESWAVKARRAAVIDRNIMRQSPVRRLAQARTVFRYTDDRTLAREMTHGYRKWTHFTARGGAGRPMGPGTAQHRLGLQRTPTWRSTVRLREGTAVSYGKVHGGRGPSGGQVVLRARTPFQDARRVVPTAPPRTELGRRLLDRARKMGLR